MKDENEKLIEKLKHTKDLHNQVNEDSKEKYYMKQQIE